VEKEPQWRGHRTAERRKTEDGFLYRDPANQTLAIKLLLWGAADPLSEGANLPNIDQFVEDLEGRDAPAAKMCRDRLNRIRELHKSGDMETCLAHVGRLTIAMQAREALEAKHQELKDERRLSEALERSISRMHERPVAVETALGQLREPQTDSPLLAGVHVTPASRADEPKSAASEDAGLSKRERQIRAIEAAADRLGYPRLSIPKGGKKAIQEKCKASYPDLFGVGNDPFLDAWSKGVADARIRTANHDTYAGR
jgi:hypothetical protein